LHYTIQQQYTVFFPQYTSNQVVDMKG